MRDPVAIEAARRELDRIRAAQADARLDARVRSVVQAAAKRSSGMSPFMYEAEKHRHLNGGSLRAAMAAVATRTPELHREHVHRARLQPQLEELADALEPTVYRRPGSATGSDFMSVARRYQLAHGGTMRAAMVAVVQQQPELHRAFIGRPS